MPKRTRRCVADQEHAGGGDQNPFQPKPADVSNVLDCLKSGVPIEVQPPCWLGRDDRSRDWVAFGAMVRGARED